jgi:hypothetical protein
VKRLLRRLWFCLAVLVILIAVAGLAAYLYGRIRYPGPVHFRDLDHCEAWVKAFAQPHWVLTDDPNVTGFFYGPRKPGDRELILYWHQPRRAQIVVIRERQGRWGMVDPRPPGGQADRPALKALEDIYQRR